MTHSRIAFARAVLILATLCIAVDASAQRLGDLTRTFGPGNYNSIAGGLAPGNDLYAQDINTRLFPGARCADGTNGLFYVRPYDGEENRSKWVFYLQGGGECKDGTDCVNRWLNSPGDDDAFDAKKLSSSNAPRDQTVTLNDGTQVFTRGIRARGIESLDSTNSFRNWNHVFVYYCSSDRWLGSKETRTSVDLTAAQITALSALLGRPVPATVSYRIGFHGADILDAAVATLLARRGVSFEDESFTERTMPSLSDATEVLFTGSSAGGAGVVHHVDRFRQQLERRTVACRTARREGTACPLRVGAVVDAAFLFPTDTVFFDHSMTPAGSYRATQVAEGTVIAGFWGGLASVDDSCLASYDQSNRWRCADLGVVLRNHVSTPMFVRMDLQDPLISSRVLSAGLQFDFGPPIGLALLQLDAIGMQAFGRLTQNALEALGLSDPARGLHGPQCGTHESLRDDGPFLVTATAAPDGGSYTTHTLLRNWWDGVGLAQVVQAYMAPPGLVPGCAP